VEFKRRYHEMFTDYVARGETVYDIIVDVKINNASRAAIGLGP
jgi:hypothetical protein